MRRQPKKAEKRFFLFFLLFVASILFFIVIMPGNHSEAEDAFEYARMIEQESGRTLYHPHHLTYLPLQQALYRGAKSLGYEGRSYPLAQSISMISGAISLLFFFAIVRRISKTENDRLAFIATAGLLFSYGFMRYACEVEIYLPAMAAALGAIYCSLRRVEKGHCGGPAILWSVFALSLHITTAAVVLGVIPLIYWMVQKNKSQAFKHVIMVCLGIGLIYGAVIKTYGLAKPNAAVTNEGGLHLASLGKGAVGLGQTMLSGNFIFSQDYAVKEMKKRFPYRVFDEELFMAKTMPMWLQAVAPVTFIAALIGLILIALFFIFRIFFKATIYREPLFWISGVWLVGTALPTLWVEPANPELWILSIPAIWMLFFVLIDHANITRKTQTRLTFVILLFGLHNVLIGMGMINSREGDYNFKKAEWVLQQAAPGDTVLTADSFVFTFYLNYWSPAIIRNLNTQPAIFGRHTYLFNDVFSPNLAIKIRQPNFTLRTQKEAKRLRPLSQKVHKDGFGGIWIVQNPN